MNTKPNKRETYKRKPKTNWVRNGYRLTSIPCERCGSTTETIKITHRSYPKVGNVCRECATLLCTSEKDFLDLEQWDIGVYGNLRRIIGEYHVTVFPSTRDNGYCACVWNRRTQESKFTKTCWEKDEAAEAALAMIKSSWRWRTTKNPITTDKAPSNNSNTTPSTTNTPNKTRHNTKRDAKKFLALLKSQI